MHTCLCVHFLRNVFIQEVKLILNFQFILMFVCGIVCKHSYAHMFVCVFVINVFIQEVIIADIIFPIYSYVCVWDCV